VKIQLLPSSFDARGGATPEQRLSCFLVDGRVAIDGGSIALNGERCRGVRDIIVTHPHMDHIATLPIFVDDLFASLDEPVRVHATEQVVALLLRDVFNGTVYPPFQEFDNGRTRVLEFVPFAAGEEFRVAHLRVTAVAVTHIVPTVGLVFTDGRATVAFSSDTAATEEFWRVVNCLPRLDALLVEASFPNSLARLAEVSGHLTPDALSRELAKLTHAGTQILAMHIKPAYRERVARELDALGVPGLAVMETGRDYSW
jgi:ribonuclease BN (tRNA processing enzyme)